MIRADPLPARLRRGLIRLLPGVDAQRRMAPSGRIPADYDPHPPGALQAAVLVLVIGREQLVFIRRATDGRAHSGQIAFPGGSREPADASLAQTALREAEEEIGLRRDHVELLGSLTPLYIPVSNFTVHPWVGYVASPPSFVCQQTEVDETIAVPVAVLHAGRGETVVRRHGVSSRVPCYRRGVVEIWGATAMITAVFLAVWEES